MICDITIAKIVIFDIALKFWYRNHVQTDFWALFTVIRLPSHIFSGLPAHSSKSNFKLSLLISHYKRFVSNFELPSHMPWPDDYIAIKNVSFKKNISLIKIVHTKVTHTYARIALEVYGVTIIMCYHSMDFNWGVLELHFLNASWPGEHTWGS